MYNVRIPTNRERYYETQRKPAAKSRSRATKKAAQRAACQISADEYMAGPAGGAGADRADPADPRSGRRPEGPRAGAGACRLEAVCPCMALRRHAGDRLLRRRPEAVRHRCPRPAGHLLHDRQLRARRRHLLPDLSGRAAVRLHFRRKPDGTGARRRSGAKDLRAHAAESA